MNCREISFILDSNASAALTSAQRVAIDAHFLTCKSCSEDWANWRSISALSIPAIPPGLRERIAALLPSNMAGKETAAGQPRRAFIIGAFLIAGAAMAAALTLQLGQDAPESGPGVVEPAQESVEGTAAEQAKPAETNAPVGDAEGPVESSAPVGATDTTPRIGLDPYSIVVFASPEADAGAVELAEFVRCHDAVVEQLRAIQGLNVITGARVSAFDGSGFSDLEIARQLGAGSLLVVHMRMGCGAIQRDSQSDALLSSLLSGVATPSPDVGWRPFATGVARGVRDATLKDSESVSAEARATLLNSTLADGERIAALNRLARGDYDSAVVAATAQIGLTSQDVGARISAWAHMRRIDDPYLVQPLLQALANDDNPIVRQQAALTLNTFLDEPGVRGSLLRAAAEDPSVEPLTGCCSVRESAEWASVASDDLAAWVHTRLLDGNLPARSRLMWISRLAPDGRTIHLRDLGDDAPTAVFELGRNETDPLVRAMAWNVLDANTLDPAFIPVLAEDLRNHPNENVRYSAAGALIDHLDDPAVRSAFEEAVSDPSVAVRSVVSPMLGRPPP